MNFATRALLWQFLPTINTVQIIAFLICSMLVTAEKQFVRLLAKQANARTTSCDWGVWRCRHLAKLRVRRGLGCYQGLCGLVWACTSGGLIEWGLVWAQLSGLVWVCSQTSKRRELVGSREVGSVISCGVVVSKYETEKIDGKLKYPKKRNPLHLVWYQFSLFSLFSQKHRSLFSLFFSET